MVIDFVFDEEMWIFDELYLNRGKTEKKILLEKISFNIRRIQIAEEKEQLQFVKKNIWDEGMEEVFFSIDGNYNNSFSNERIPYSVKIEVNDYSDRIIHIPQDVHIDSDLDSQKKWRIAAYIQCSVLILMVNFVVIILSLVCNKMMCIFIGMGIALSIFSMVLYTRKVDYIIKKLNFVANEKI